MTLEQMLDVGLDWMTSVIIAAAAEEEFAEALFWYSQRSLRAATDFDLELNHAIEQISAAPDRFPTFDQRHRFYLLRRFPYFVLYRIESNAVLVVAIAHTSRKPDYWRDR